MTIKEIKNLKNGTQLLFEGDNITIFTKEENGILCDNKGVATIMPFQVVEFCITKWSKK